MSTFKAIRDELKLTQVEMAALLGMTQSNVSFYEKGQTVPPAVAGKLIEIAKSRGVDLSFDVIYAGEAAKA